MVDYSHLFVPRGVFTSSGNIVDWLCLYPQIMELSSTAQRQASDLVSKAQRVKDLVEPAAAAELGQRANQAQDDAQALLAVAQVSIATLGVQAHIFIQLNTLCT